MKRNNKEITAEILRRVEFLDSRDTNRKNRIRSALSYAACLAFVVGFSLSVPLVIPDDVIQVAAGYQTATLFASGEAGGYVLVGVAAFIIGGAAMLFCVNKFGKK